MRIDWKALRPGDSIGIGDEECDWTDPTHVPLMVDYVVDLCGNLSECLDDDELQVLEVVALDAMPGGKDSVIQAVTDSLYDLAATGDWSEWLYVRGTDRYEYEGEEA